MSLRRTAQADCAARWTGRAFGRKLGPLMRLKLSSCSPTLARAGLWLWLLAGALPTAWATEPGVPPTAAAAASAPVAASAATSAAADGSGLLDSAQQSVRSAAEWMARRVDGWFGDTPFEHGGSVSDGRLSLGLFKRQDQNLDTDLRFNARFRLPNVERNAYLFIGRDNQRAITQDTPDPQTRQQQLLSERATDRTVLAGVGLLLRDSLDLRLGVGAHFKPYVRARYEQPWTLSPGHTIGFRQTVFWTPDDRAGSTTALSWDLLLTSGLSLRWLNAATITQESRNVEWSSSVGAYLSLDDQRLLTLELLTGGTGRRGPGPRGMSDHGVLLKWEEPVYRQWLLLEIAGGHFWPRPDVDSPRGRAWALGSTLKLRF